MTISIGPSWVILCHFSGVDSQSAHKIPDSFGYPISTGSRTLCYKEIHPLLLECFMSFHRCMGNVGGVSGSIYKSLVVHTMWFYSRLNLKLYANCQIWGCLSIEEKDHNIIKGRYPLLLKYFIPLLRCMKNVEGLSDKIYKSLMCQTVPFLSSLTLKSLIQCKIQGTLSR